MRGIGFHLFAILLLASVAEAKQEAAPQRAFFSERRVDFWRDGGADRKPASDAETGAVESPWAEPIRLPDGRYTTYVPPRAVLEFLENPTRENALKYLEWQSERMGKMRKAAAVLAEVSRERSTKGPRRQDVPVDPIAITYFKKASCPYCAKQDVVLSGLKGKHPNFEIKTLEPGQEPALWQRLGITTVPALLIGTPEGRPVMLRGYSDAARILNAVRGVTHEGK